MSSKCRNSMTQTLTSTNPNIVLDYRMEETYTHTHLHTDDPLCVKVNIR